jgi:arginine exporter protein ArgO
LAIRVAARAVMRAGAMQPAPLQPSFLAGAGLASTVWFCLLGFGLVRGQYGP